MAGSSQQLPSAQRPNHPHSPHGPHAPHGHHHHKPHRKESPNTLLYLLLIGLAVAGGVFFLVSRDTWEQDNKTFILELKKDADANRTAQKREALKKYDAVVKLTLGRALKDASLVYASEESRRQRDAIVTELSAEADAENLARSKGLKPEAEKQLSPELLKKHSEEHAAYLQKTQGLLDTFDRTKSEALTGAAAGGTTLQKYQDSIRENTFQYNKWFDALTNTEAGYPSARLLKTTLDTYALALSWWQIETDKKMPEALFAGIMRDNEWSKAASLQKYVQICIAQNDLVERKKCPPCDGSGKIKCPICLGTGICQYCKGQPSPLNCCTVKGVCEACKGRRESACPICNGEGQFPPK